MEEEYRYGPRSLLRSFSSGSTSSSPTDIVVPSMGDSISEGTVVEWLKGPGEYVAEDEVIVVLETDKVSVDVRSSVAGVIDQTLAEVDATVLVGAPLATIIPGPDVSSSVAKTPDSKQELQASIRPESTVELETVIVPSMGDSISEGTVVEWLKGPGEYVAEDEVIVVLETDKVSVDVRSSVAGVIESILASVDEVVEIGTALATIQPVAEGSAAPAPAQPVTPEPPVVVQPPTPAPVSEERPVRREKMNRMRLRIAERLKESQNVSASLTTFQECDMGNLMALRKQYKVSVNPNSKNSLSP